MVHTQKPVRTFGSELWDSFYLDTDLSVPFGGAVRFSDVTAGAESIMPAVSGQSILGFADKREFVPEGGYDHFWTHADGLPIPIVTKRAYALVVPNGAALNIDAQDYLEIAALGDGSTTGHGILEEAGAGPDGTVFTDDVVAQAVEAVTMGADSYKVPAGNVAVGATTATMSAGDIALMDVEEGDLILLEDLNGDIQVNAVADTTSTVITFVKPSTVLLTAGNNDLITKIYQCKVRVGKF